MRIALLFILFCLGATQIFAQNIVETYGARANALGNGASTHSDVFSVFTNQAGLANVETISVGVWGENRFLISDLNAAGLAVAIPTKSGTFGLGVNSYGLESFNTQRATLAYGRKLFENRLSIGAEFDLYNFNVGEFGNTPANSTTVINFGLGIQYSFKDRFIAAAHILNPIEAKLTDRNDLIESVFKLGLSYIPSDQVGIYLETKKSYHFPASFIGGIEYSILKKLTLRAGFTTLPSRIIDGRYSTDLATFSAGIGLNFKPIFIDIANRFHPVLGSTPSISISFNKTKKVADEKL